MLMPFIYRFVHTPEQLFAVRMVHGLATAIYGPVTLAYVSEQSRARRAERLAWFGMARNAGYIVGPAAAGWMLLTMDPVAVFTLIGVLSSFAFLPVVLLPEKRQVQDRLRLPFAREALTSLLHGSKTPGVWLAGGLEASVYVALYAMKAFLPIYALSAGYSVAIAGTFFAVQEGAHMLLYPLGGRVGDRLGFGAAIPLGMVVLGLSLSLLVMERGAIYLLVLAAVIGSGQALVFPSTVALVSNQVGSRNLATGMGLLGTMKNAGKVTGPALGGILIHWLGYPVTFQLLGIGLVLGAGIVWQGLRVSRKSETDAGLVQSGVGHIGSGESDTLRTGGAVGRRLR